MKKIVSVVLAVVVLVSLIGTWGAVQATPAYAVRLLGARANKIDADVRDQVAALGSGGMITVIVTLRQQADLSRLTAKDHAERQRRTVEALQYAATAHQGGLARFLQAEQAQGRVKRFTPLWVLNGFSLTATRTVIDELAQNPDVFQISADDLNIVPSLGSPESNISLVNAPALWGQGNSGQGVVVANMDSGVDSSHPDLTGRWRGGSNSWYDPYGQHPTTPTDLTGHGSQTMGVMVGGDAGGTTIGMAPGAKWVAVKIFNDQGTSSATAIHQGYQWLLDPDHNPATADAPQVVNNSWSFGSPGCFLDFEPDLQSLRAAGILPVFAAGNGGPGSSTSYSPANNPSAFAVGAINNLSQIYAYSSRGPSTCGGAAKLVFPDLVAPGVNIRASDLFGAYYSATGTSFAAPHVAGALALLLAAYPGLSAADQAAALTSSAVDLGAVGPDNAMGYGRLDVLAAFNWLTAHPTATPLPATATATPLPPTATATVTPLPPTTTATATSLPPTATPTATATTKATLTSTFLPLASSTAAFTATSQAKRLHVGDLANVSGLSGTNKWNASVTILIHDGYHTPLANVVVSAKWSNGTSGSVSCTTNSAGLCTLSKTGLSNTIASVTLTVTSAARTGYAYVSSANHDANGDSNGTLMVVVKP